MALQRSSKIEFITVSGILAACSLEGFSIQLTDDGSQTYLVNVHRHPRNLEPLLGSRVEIKGLVESVASPFPQIHPLRVVASH